MSEKLPGISSLSVMIYMNYRELRDGAEPARIGYSEHWRANNQNPALAKILRILGERYLLPA